MNNELILRITKDDDGKVDMKVDYPEDNDLVTLGMAAILFFQDHVTLVKYLNAVKEHLAEIAEQENGKDD